MWGLEGAAVSQAALAAPDAGALGEPVARPSGPGGAVEPPAAVAGSGKGDRKKRKKKGGRR
jgi:hypothetical protein